MRKRKTLEQKRLFQGHCDLIISKLFSPDTPNYYRNTSASYQMKDKEFFRKLFQDQKL